MVCLVCQPPALPQPPHGCHLLPDVLECSSCRELKDIESQISRVREALSEAQISLNALLKRHQETRTRINHAHDSLFSRLPLEVISTVFQHLVPRIPFDRRPLGDLVRPKELGWTYISPLLVLGAVSRDWRRITRSTPSLWRSIVIRLNMPKLDSYVDLVRGWLERSGSLTLFIKVYFDFDSEWVNPEDVHAMVNIVNQHSGRWEMLDLQLPACLIALFCGDQHSPSVLRYLRLASLDEDDVDKIFIMDNTVPRPTDVYIYNIPCASISIGWDNVTWLKAENLQLFDYLQLMKRGPLIRYCCFLPVYARESNLPMDNMVHNHIEELVMKYPRQAWADAFFSHVILPSLKKLVLISRGEEFTFQTLASHLGKSSCHLQELALAKVIIATEDLINFLKDQNFGLSQGWTILSRAVFRLIFLSRYQVADSDEPFLPNLKLLYYDALWPFSWKSVARILSPPDRPGNPQRRPLKTLQLRVHKKTRRVKASIPLLDKDSASSLLSAAKAGVDIRVYSCISDHEYSDIFAESTRHHGLVDNSADTSNSNVPRAIVAG
ncbi:hypothetical protein CVT26_002408 [Gymnopilus dilepis]|uniref:F-box domain-containing protein n=1 Tax=Gymnopilus dilepis TaxID=231916 RepID=A0A409YN35_9AGAR|nr:hypothetical protein CVT26_002408 [Gymnopilus dilepis]